MSQRMQQQPDCWRPYGYLRPAAPPEGSSWAAEREANAQHLWAVIQAELARIRGGTVDPGAAWDQQPSDMRQALVVGAAALRSMER